MPNCCSDFSACSCSGSDPVAPALIAPQPLCPMLSSEAETETGEQQHNVRKRQVADIEPPPPTDDIVSRAAVHDESVGVSSRMAEKANPVASSNTDSGSGCSGLAPAAAAVLCQHRSGSPDKTAPSAMRTTSSIAEDQCIARATHSDTGLYDLEEDTPMASALGIGVVPLRQSLSLSRSEEDLYGTHEQDWFEAQDFRGLIDTFILEINSKSGGQARTVKCLDLFAGSGAVSKAFTTSGHCATSFDIARDPSCDFTSQAGFLKAVSMLLQVRRGGLVMAGPPCSLWTFMASSVHSRSAVMPEGNLSNAKVRMSNLIVRNLAVVLSMAHDRGVHWIIEQPQSSRMWDYPPLAGCLFQCKARRRLTYMGCFGHDMEKATVLWGTLPTLKRLARSLSQCRETFTGRPDTGSRYYVRDASGVRGRPCLHNSAAYPAGFGDAVLDAWMQAAH